MLYKSETTEGTIVKYRRVGSFSGYNELNKVPSISFNEEEITILPDGTTLTKDGVDRLTQELSDPAGTFELLNPETDEVIGEVSQQEIYVILYSIYRSLTNKRDTYVTPTEELPVGDIVGDGPSA